MNNRLATLLLATVFLAAGDASQTRTRITIKGSDTMVILGQQWAETYMARHPDVIIQVTAGGSGTGFSALITGTTDVAFASRPMSRRERDLLRKRVGTEGYEIRCAIDGLSLFVHPDNPVHELSVRQVREIYTGRLRSWRDVGGPETPIILYGRESNSGTYAFLREEVLKGEEYAANVLMLPGTAAVVNAVARDKNAIGYGGVAYGRGIQELKIRSADDSLAYAPTLENIYSQRYPISRYLYLYLRSEPAGALKEFVNWVLSDEGQDVVRRVGYFPLR